MHTPLQTASDHGVLLHTSVRREARGGRAELVCLRCPGPQVRNSVLKRERVGHVSPNP